MITLFYTGANAYQLPQYMPEKSLGGYVGGASIPNGRLNNLFNDESYEDNSNGSVAHRAIALTTDASLTGLTITCDNDPTASNYTLQIAAVTLISPANQKMEAIENEGDVPYIGTFVPIDINTIQSIGNLSANQTIGIWMKRTIIKATPQSCADLSILAISTTNTPTNIQLKFSYI